MSTVCLLFPAVLSALKSRQARVALCDELAQYKSGNQVILEHQQFDMVRMQFHEIFV